MKIVSLNAENVKRLSAVHITPDGSMVVIGGENGQGKTSVLDSIWYALGGKSALPGEPVRKGEKKATIELDLGDLRVTRTITPDGGGSLKVTSREGATFPSPQTMLDKLVGSLSFDPLAFARLPAKEQAETLRKLAGLDFAAQDGARRALFDERTEVNRDVKRLEATRAGLLHHPDAPAEEVDAATLVEEIERIASVNRQHEVKRQELVAASGNAKLAISNIARMKEDIARAQELLADAEAGLVEVMAAGKALKASVAELVDLDPEPVKAHLRGVTATNARVRDNAASAKAEKDLTLAVEKADALTDQIDALDEAKAAAISAAKLPLEGLGFGEAGVTLRGVPFAQGSAAEQLRASVAMGLALNPTLRVLLVRDGSLLDKRSLALLAEMAEAADAQVWVERVGDGAEVGVVIEDGAVRA